MAGGLFSVSTDDYVIDLEISSAIKKTRASCKRPDYSSIYVIITAVNLRKWLWNLSRKWGNRFM